MLFAVTLLCASAADDAAVARIIRERYTKHVYRISMRDGAKLHTHVFVPKNETQTYPILFMRTPYSVEPYGADAYPNEKGVLKGLLR